MSAKHGLSDFYLDEAALDWAINHTWPGNLPELERFVEKAILAEMADQKSVLAEFADDIPVLEDVVLS